MTIEEEKDLLIDAIYGRGVCGGYTFALDMEKRRLAKFTGNQWNENWDWDKYELSKLPIEELKSLYLTIKRGQ
jgi:hypothetical protein